MAGQRQPIDLLLIKGKKNLTKQEIEERKEKEVKAPADKVRAPNYLSRELKKEFNKIAKELKRIEIMSNLDVDALARFLIAREKYLKIDETLNHTEVMVEQTFVNEMSGEETVQSVFNMDYKELTALQDKFFKQCRQASADLGLTISSRCKLVVPKTEEDKEKTEEEKMFGNV
jgi:P27 family predicted phage terminase small subunit